MLFVLLTCASDNLAYVYPRHSSCYHLKGFSVHLFKYERYYAATAVARLGPPISLADDFDFELQDEFVGTYSKWSFVDALESLWEMVLIELGGVGEALSVVEQGMNL
jgi:hypothetical protein